MATPPRHDASGRRQDLLYDPAIPTPTHAERAITLAARGGEATLATLCAEDPVGHPFASLVLVALHGRDPVLLISNLAAHTLHLRADPRCSLLIRERGEGPVEALALARATLVGRAEVTRDPGHRDAFLRRHPDSSGYADFRDFAFWRIAVERIRYIGGFGRMSWVEGDDWSRASPDPIDPHASAILDHMNADHVDAMRLMCRAYSRAGEVEQVVMTSVDRYGFELSARVADGDRPIRVAFPREVHTPAEVRAEMVALVKRARALSASGAAAGGHPEGEG